MSIGCRVQSEKNFNHVEAWLAYCIIHHFGREGNKARSAPGWPPRQVRGQGRQGPIPPPRATAGGGKLCEKLWPKIMRKICEIMRNYAKIMRNYAKFWFSFLTKSQVTQLVLIDHCMFHFSNFNASLASLKPLGTLPKRNNQKWIVLVFFCVAILSMPLFFCPHFFASPKFFLSQVQFCRVLNFWPCKFFLSPRQKSRFSRAS